MPRDKNLPAASQFEWMDAEEKARVLAARPPGVSISNYIRGLMGLPPLQGGRRQLTPDEMREKLKDPNLTTAQQTYYRAALRGRCLLCDAPPIEGRRYCASCAQTNNRRVKKLGDDVRTHTLHITGE